MTPADPSPNAEKVRQAVAIERFHGPAKPGWADGWMSPKPYAVYVRKIPPDDARRLVKHYADEDQAIHRAVAWVTANGPEAEATVWSDNESRTVARIAPTAGSGGDDE